MFRNKFIFILVLIISAFTAYLLTYSRYVNQELSLDNFRAAYAGNIITMVFFGLILILIVFNLFSKYPFKPFSLITVFALSVLGLISLFISINLTDKDQKIIYSTVFLVLYVYMTVSLFTLAVSRSKKLHLFNNFGLMLVICLFFFVLVFYMIYNYEDDSKIYESGDRKSDAGVVLGAAVWGGNRPSPVLRERINKGFEIYQKKYVQKLILTGAGSPNEMTEAEVAKNELIKYGVDPKHLLVEKKSNSTNEQIRNVRDRYYFRGNFRRIIIVSDNFHLFRSKEICRFDGLEVDCFSSDTPLSTESTLNFCVKESFAVIFFWLFGIG